MTFAPSTISHGFELQREERIDEIDSVARLYRHQKTGAELLSVIGGDENKVFGVAFRTPPADSSGVAHILEHSVLCGSRKYPVKAPFLEMLKGSLKTFLNAMTYSDKTVYPVASVNLQDFYNLVDVYLDAVFHPRLTPEILQQEGWHYELDAAGRAADLQGRRLQRNEGQLFLAGRPCIPAFAAIALSGQHLWRRFGRRSARHSEPHLRKFQGVPRALLSPLERQILLLWRRRSGKAACAARWRAERIFRHRGGFGYRTAAALQRAAQDRAQTGDERRRAGHEAGQGQRQLDARRN